MTTYTNPFTAQTISPAQVGYESLTISASTTLQWPINGNDTTNVVANIIEVSALTAGLNLLLPTALQVSTGQAVLIRNVGANTFTVTDISGNTIASIPTGVASGIAVYIYLTDNTTANGSWSAITFGAGTSAANAASLAGAGLVALSTTLNQQYVVQTLSSATTLTSAARAQMIVWTGGAGIITLPSASSVTANWFTIIKNDGTGILTLNPAGYPSNTDLIDGSSNQQLQLGESLVLVSAGTTWYSFAYGRSNAFPYTQLTLAANSGTITETSLQASSTIQTLTGTLTAAQTIILPPTVQLYSFYNNTSGTFTVTVKTSASGSVGVLVTQGKVALLVSDGTNVYNATSSASGSVTSPLNLANGSAVAPTVTGAETTTGVYFVGSGATSEVDISINQIQRYQFTATNLIAVAIGAGSF